MERAHEQSDEEGWTDELVDGRRVEENGQSGKQTDNPDEISFDNGTGNREGKAERD